MPAAPASDERGAAESLREEGALLGRYLLGRAGGPPGSGILARYAEGCARLFTEPEAPRDRAILAYVHRHPWSLPFLDAACALARPQASLRSRLILMLAILETTPEHAALFIAPPRPRLAAIWGLARDGSAGAIKAAVGLLILTRAGAPR